MKRLIILTMVLLLGATAVWAQPTTKRLRPFTFILALLPYGEYSPYFTALEKGWYRDEGLEVKILRGAGSGDTIKRIAAGQGDAGEGDFSAFVGARANEDIKVKAVAAYFRRPPHSIFVRTDSGITGPKELEGRTIATTPGNSIHMLFPLFAQLANFKPDGVKWVTMDAAAMGPALITKSVDAAVFFANHEGRLQKQARQQGASLKRLAYSDYGLDMYSLVMFAREETIAKDSDALRGFVRATLKGMRYAFAPEHIEEGARIVQKANPELDLEATIGAAKVASEYAFTDEIKSGKVELGQFEPARVERSRDIYTRVLNLKRRVPAEELYTNDLLPARK